MLTRLITLIIWQNIQIQNHYGALETNIGLFVNYTSVKKKEMVGVVKLYKPPLKKISYAVVMYSMVIIVNNSVLYI